MFSFMADGILIILYALKVYYGLQYLNIIHFLPKMSYSFLEEHGDLKWHTRRVKLMRIAFKNYFLVSAVATVFILLQTTLLFFVILQDLNSSFRYSLLFVNAIVQLVLMLGPIKNHILELDEQVTYRIKRIKDAEGRTA